MKITCVIPSRYNSTRLPGKPLIEFCDKPMIWWVYNSVSKTKGLDKIIVATDDDRILETCKKYNIPAIMTSQNHENCFHRLHEVSNIIKSDKYLLVNGDEPLIEPTVIQEVINKILETNPYFLFTYRHFSDPSEVMDSGNIKVVTSNNKLMYLSRIPIPYPHKSTLFQYKKIIGVQAFSKEALDFFVNTPAGELEKIEDIAELRWIEKHKVVDCYEVNSKSISVDNVRDIERVVKIMKEDKYYEC